MRAAFAPGGDGGQKSDPALEPSEVGGHTLLQRRLALYGKVLVVQSILYWLIYAIIWGPTVGFTQSLAHIASWDVVLLTAIYSLYWIAARGPPRSAPILLATDIGGSLLIGIDNVFLMLGDLAGLVEAARRRAPTPARGRWQGPDRRDRSRHTSGGARRSAHLAECPTARVSPGPPHSS
jgi:hypothetical protein